MDQNSQYNGNSYPYPDEAGNRQPVSPHPVVVNQLEHKKDGLAVCSLVTGIFSILLVPCHSADSEPDRGDHRNYQPGPYWSAYRPRAGRSDSLRHRAGDWRRHSAASFNGHILMRTVIRYFLSNIRNVQVSQLRNLHVIFLKRCPFFRRGSAFRCSYQKSAFFRPVPSHISSSFHPVPAGTPHDRSPVLPDDSPPHSENRHPFLCALRSPGSAFP